MRLLIFLMLMAAAAALPAQLPLDNERVIVSNALNINTDKLDFSPSYFRDGIVYVSSNVEDLRYKIEDVGTGTNIMKLWKASRSLNGALFDPQPFYEELNSSLHEGPVTFDSSYTQIFFTRNDNARRSRKLRKSLRQLNIYTADLVAGQWRNEREVPFNDARANDAHPTLSSDGQLLIFASDRDGGVGGMDLWAVAKQGNVWGKPHNLGPDINTRENDVFPFLHSDGTLYFSSTTTSASAKQANLDIYYSRQTNSRWSSGTNLSPPFNTDQDDYGLIVGADNLRGYFSSDRPGGLGSDDIYSFEIIPKTGDGPLNLTVQVSNARTGEALAGATLSYIYTGDISLAGALQQGLVKGSADVGLQLVGGKSATTDAAGKRTLKLASGDYMLSIESKGYASIQVPLSLAASDLTLPIALEPQTSCSNLQVVVLDEVSLNPVPGARVRFSAQLAGSETDLSTDEQGVANFCAPCEDIFGITATLGSQLSSPAAYDTRGSACTSAASTTMTLYLRSAGSFIPADNPLVEGTVIQLPSVYYPLDRWELSVGARSDLNHLAIILDRYPGMQIELGSHTDALGPRQYNAELSQRRATEAKRYLVQEAGIDASRISAIGFGESQPRNRCTDGVHCSPAEYRENRRTEIRITHVDNPVSITAALQEAAARGISGTYTQELRPAAPRRLSSTSTGSYWVVAGTFQENRNATRRQAELEQLGYSGVTIVSFENVNAKAVVVGKFTQLAEAAQFTRALKEAHRIAAYVRRVN